MAINYSQLSQTRENSTNAVSIYSPSLGDTVQLFIKVTNVGVIDSNCRLFHDDDGTIYDESTAILWDITVSPGEIIEVDHVFMNNENGNIAYRSSIANALVATVYGIVRTT